MKTKLNLGCGFKKKTDFINVDIEKNCEPDVCMDLSSEKWPWQDNSVEQVDFDFSLEQMGHTFQHLKHVIQELYRVCAKDAKIHLKFIHPRHDQFALNPMCTQKLSPEFFSMLSLANNLQQIAREELDASLAMLWNVNFEISRSKFIINPKFQQAVESGQISEVQLRESMAHQANICHFVEVDLLVKKI